MSVLGRPAGLLSVSESFLGTVVEVKLPVNCAGGQPAQPSRIRTTEGMLGKAPPRFQ